MLSFGLNHMTAPTLDTEAFLALAQQTGCIGVEFRTDLGRPLFEGMAPESVRDLATASGLRILGLAEVKAFNIPGPDKAREALALCRTAVACGAEAVALIPRVGTSPTDRGEQRDMLAAALRLLRPILVDHGLTGLVEPLGFTTSTLRHKDDATAVLDAMDRPACFRLVHDTFHHYLSGDVAFHAELTGLVHVSGVADDLPPDAMTDAHRVLVGADDRLGNISQLRALAAQGYAGPVSFEAFSPAIHRLADPASALAASITFILSQMPEVLA